MQLQITSPGATEPVSKVKIALGAASLFLFIVGVKRSYDGSEASGPSETTPDDGSAQNHEKPRRKKVRPVEAG
jgi:hypothetical protein